MPATIQVRANVRPLRVAALVGPNATPRELATFFGLASRVWGGRYWPMIRVADPISAADRRRIAAHGPDVLCGLGLDMAVAAPAVAQELGMIPYLPVLDPDEVLNSPLRPVSADATIERLSREYPVINESRITVWEQAEECPLALLYAASFGSQSRQTAEILSRRFKAEIRVVNPAASTTDFIADSVHMARRVSWLDLGSYGLDHLIRHGDGFFSPHTIILVGASLSELASYWTIRSQRDRDTSGFFLPLPIHDAHRRDVIEALVGWVKVLPLNSNLMRIVCDPQHVAEARRLAMRLRRRLSPKPYEFIDVHLIDEIEPTVVAIDGEHQFDAAFEAGVLTFDPPQPRSIDSHSRAYMVDLVKDRVTGRAPNELFLPQRRVVVDVLRAQSPPFFAPGLPQLGLSFGYTSIRATHSAPCRFQVPSIDELLGEILREGGFASVPDEKRLRYETVIAMFGGLPQTAEALVGYSGSLLRTLADKGTLTLQEIRGAMAPYATLETATPPRSDWLDPFLAGLPETTQRVTRERFDRHRSLLLRSDDELSDLLAKFSRLRVLLRSCRPDRCNTCLDHSWIDHLDLSHQLLCPNCGQERHVPASLPIGYTINPVVKLALAEGIGPVVLTGRLLYHLTSNSFLWAPRKMSSRMRQSASEICESPS